MKSITYLVLLILLSSQACGQNKSQQYSKSEKSNSETLNGFALIELFTSQGCSSCPSADDNLTELMKDATIKGKKVYALAFHVDYWNRLGWKDPFSSSKYSDRQSMYVSALHLQSAYTPQMIVNGETQFVGSDNKLARSAIAKGLATSNDYSLTLGSASTTDGDVSTIPYRIEGNIVGKKLCIAIVENGKVTNVKSGENRGRTLQNNHVVMWFDSITPDQFGSITLPKEQIKNRSNVDVVIFLQDERTKKILAAEGLKL